MAFWAQGKRQSRLVEQGSNSTSPDVASLAYMKDSGIQDNDWLDRWYPPQTRPNAGSTNIKNDCPLGKSRWGLRKRFGEAGQNKPHKSKLGMLKQNGGKENHQEVYSITSADHFNSDAQMSTLLTKSSVEDQGSISLLNRIAKHILKLDNDRDERKKPLPTHELGSVQEKPKQVRDLTLPSPRNVEGALASPFYDPDFWVPRRPLAPNRVYHFHVIYNHAQNSVGRSCDTDLALRVAASLVEKLELRGYVNG